jgi:hypothetical protein
MLLICIVNSYEMCSMEIYPGIKDDLNPSYIFLVWFTQDVITKLYSFFIFADMQGPVHVALARECQSQSHQFVGVCTSDTNCGSVCKNEGFEKGNCHGTLHRCFCVKEC